MVKMKYWTLFLVLALALSSCGKKGPVRPIDSDLSNPVQKDKPANNCCSG